MNIAAARVARLSARGCAIAALAAPALAAAVLVAGPGGTAEQGRRTVVTTPAAAQASAPALDLVPARLSAVDAAGGRVVVNGKTVQLDTARLRVIGPGGQRLAGVSSLAAGQQIRFALEPGTALARRIVLIYIDR